MVVTATGLARPRSTREVPRTPARDMAWCGEDGPDWRRGAAGNTAVRGTTETRKGYHNEENDGSEAMERRQLCVQQDQLTQDVIDGRDGGRTKLVEEEEMVGGGGQGG